MASPAEIANDMAAHADYWRGRDRNHARDCGDAAWIIRAFIAGERVDGRTYGGLHRRLLNRISGRSQFERAAPNYARALSALQRLKAEARS